MPFNVYTQTSHLTLKIIIFSIGMILICSIMTLANEGDKDRGEGTQVPKKTIEEVLKEHTNKLMSLPGVVGTGQGLCNGQPCIKVFVSRKTGKLEQRIPKNLDGYPVVIQETGKFKSLGDT
jgi:hypothetical protein